MCWQGKWEIAMSQDQGFDPKMPGKQCLAPHTAWTLPRELWALQQSGWWGRNEGENVEREGGHAKDSNKWEKLLIFEFFHFSWGLWWLEEWGMSFIALRALDRATKR